MESGMRRTREYSILIDICSSYTGCFFFLKKLFRKAKHPIYSDLIVSHEIYTVELSGSKLFTARAKRSTFWNLNAGMFHLILKALK